MMVSWSALTFTPDQVALRQFHESWGWRFDDAFDPVLVTVLGDVFVQLPLGVYWLQTSTAELVPVAEDVLKLVQLFRTERMSEWFRPELIAKLHKKHRKPRTGECFSLITLPMDGELTEALFHSKNVTVVSAQVHFAVTGAVHRHLRLAHEVV